MFSALLNSRLPLCHREKAIANAKRLYQNEILPKYRDTHSGCLVLIDGVSGDYEFGDDPLVLSRMRERNPEAVIHMATIGSETAFGGSGAFAPTKS